MINMGKGGCYTYESTEAGVRYDLYQELETRHISSNCEYFKTWYRMEDIEYDDFMNFVTYMIMERCVANTVDIWKGGFYDYIITDSGFAYGKLVPQECVKIFMDEVHDDYVCESISSEFWPENID